mgnify:CR=1 FL=1
MINLKKLAIEIKENESLLSEVLELFNSEESDRFKNLDEARSFVSHIVNELISLDDIHMDDKEFLYISFIKDYDLEVINDEEIIVSYESSYDAALYLPESKETYSCMTEPFEKLANKPIWPKSIERYGKARVFYEGVWELTWFGISKDDSNQNQDKFIKELDETSKELEENPGKAVSLDELWGLLGLEKPVRSDKYNRVMKEEMLKCADFNKYEFDKLDIVLDVNRNIKEEGNMITYQVTIDDHFTSEDFNRASQAVKNELPNEEYKLSLSIPDTEDKITISINGSLRATLVFLEYLLESEIGLDIRNRLTQNGEQTQTELKAVVELL